MKTTCPHVNGLVVGASFSGPSGPGVEPPQQHRLLRASNVLGLVGALGRAGVGLVGPPLRT